MDDSTYRNVWAVIPVYNNGESIRAVVSRSVTHVEHLLVVDDGSTDVNVKELLNDLDVVVLQHNENRGKGAALRTAMNYIYEAGGEFMITLDGDGQHFPGDIPRLLEQLDKDTILIGKREEVTGDMPRHSRFGRRFSDFWVFEVQYHQKLSLGDLLNLQDQ